MIRNGRRTAFVVLTPLLATLAVCAIGEAALRITGVSSPRAQELFAGRLLKGKPYARFLHVGAGY